MNKQRGYTIYELLFLVVIIVGLALVVGWFVNIYKLAAMCCDMSGMLILRAAGIFLPPLGGVVGFL